MSKSSDDFARYPVEIKRNLAKLEKLSPREIKTKIGGHRRNIQQPEGLLANWLCEKLGVEKITVKTENNVYKNLTVMVEISDTFITYKFFVRTSLQDFLGIKKKPDLITGISLSPEQSILVRAIIDRQGGDESSFVKDLLNAAFADSELVASFVKRIKDHPEWHAGMHEAGLYPADIFEAEKAIKKAKKK